VDDRLSAQVVLRPVSGALSGNEQITSENVQSFVPSPDAVAETSGFFRGAGFEVADLVGISFSIVGSPSVFEQVFGERPERSVEKGIDTVRTRAAGLELDLGQLPESVRRHLQAVTFTPPPAFGPTNP
jgi:hypothetical protein